MQNNKEDLSFENQKIQDIWMEKEIKKSFIEYSMSVIISRALPDVRDGMKPGQRRIMYAMHEDHITHQNKFRKSATTVGNVLGRYHPHGDAAVYGTMVRMAQPFNYRYPLVEGQGNFGSVDGDSAAAYRYTEARMSRIADYLMSDLEKEVVEFVPNFDNSRREPSILPSRFPNILVNGSVGIAVGMATNIPPHNLGEVIDATIHRMDNPDCTVRDLMEFIKGPDFPTAATIHGTAGIYNAYSTGKGRITVRAKADVEEDKHRIIITEIPYMVNKSMLCEAIADLIKEKRIEGVTGLRDESGRDGMRIVIEHKHDVNGNILLNQLYKYTQLQDTCAVNMLAIVDGEPKILSLPEVLDKYIAHQESVIIRRTKFDLDKALAREHIYLGYKKALDHIDEIIEVIKKSPSIPVAKERLIELFDFSEIQAQAIVDMTLGKLTGLEKQKIEDELARLQALIAELRGILADIGKVKEIIKTEMLEIKDKFADERRTEIEAAVNDIELEDLIEKHNCVITATHYGYIKRLPADTYSVQNRGGKGVIGMSTKEEDFIEDVLVVPSHSDLLFFTNHGKVYMKKAYMIPESSRTAKGTNIVNIIDIDSTNGEHVSAIIPVDAYDDNSFLTMVTKQGVIKKTKIEEFEQKRKGGKIGIILDEGDELIYVGHTNGDNDIVIATRNGNAVRFHEDTVRVIGRSARGVRGMTVREGDYVVGVAVVDEAKQLITITENGYGKRTPFDDLKVKKNRGGSGVQCHNINEKTGLLCSIATVSESDDIMMITNTGTIIRTPVNTIPSYSRAASGVIVMRLDEGKTLVNFALCPSDSENYEETDEE